mmetsp:Transcript_9307/g.29598  ORF Transcript_9307/g.29598 Transcript_9307/m.29598 type:complete len:232 (-) Transcript_9307:36-731(-)
MLSPNTSSFMFHSRHSALNASSSPSVPSSVHGRSATASVGDGNADTTRIVGGVGASLTNSAATQLPIEWANAAHGAAGSEKSASFSTSNASFAIAAHDSSAGSFSRASRPGGCAAYTSTPRALAHLISRFSRRPASPPNAVLSGPVYTFSEDPAFGNVTSRSLGTTPSSTFVSFSRGNHTSIVVMHFSSTDTARRARRCSDREESRREEKTTPTRRRRAWTEIPLPNWAIL